MHKSGATRRKESPLKGQHGGAGVLDPARPPSAHSPAPGPPKSATRRSPQSKKRGEPLARSSRVDHADKFPEKLGQTLQEGLLSKFGDASGTSFLPWEALPGEFFCLTLPPSNITPDRSLKEEVYLPGTLGTLPQMLFMGGGYVKILRLGASSAEVHPQ